MLALPLVQRSDAGPVGRAAASPRRVARGSAVPSIDAAPHDPYMPQRGASARESVPRGAQADMLQRLLAANAGMLRLADLDVSGRTMITFMRGHMSEMRTLLEVREYFAAFYDRMGREFIQYDDYDFVVHHCVRHQFWHMKEELDLLRAGPLGQTLAEIGAPLPELGSPTRAGRSPLVAKGWYDEVYRSLASGLLPQPRGVRNPVMPAGDCVMRRPQALDLIWPQFLVWSTEVWGRQIVASWQVLGSLIALRRAVYEQASAGQVEQLVRNDEVAFRAAARALADTYHGWHDFHAVTVDVHDPMYDANRAGMFDWAGGLAADITDWRIQEATKDEMYLELAATVLALRGHPVSVDLPEPAYWRRTQFAPNSIRAGATGMPPF
jgi:hypothetical protein